MCGTDRPLLIAATRMVWFLLTMGVQDGAVIGASAGLLQLIPRHTERCREDYSSSNAISIHPSGERMDGSPHKRRMVFRWSASTSGGSDGCAVKSHVLPLIIFDRSRCLIQRRVEERDCLHRSIAAPVGRSLAYDLDRSAQNGGQAPCEEEASPPQWGLWSWGEPNDHGPWEGQNDQRAPSSDRCRDLCGWVCILEHAQYAAGDCCLGTYRAQANTALGGQRSVPSSAAHSLCRADGPHPRPLSRTAGGPHPRPLSRTAGGPHPRPLSRAAGEGWLWSRYC